VGAQEEAKEIESIDFKVKLKKSIYEIPVLLLHKNNL
jgi:hypothetical protein